MPRHETIRVVRSTRLLRSQHQVQVVEASIVFVMRDLFQFCLIVAYFCLSAAFTPHTSLTKAQSFQLFESVAEDKPPVPEAAPAGPKEVPDYEIPGDAVVVIQPAAMRRLRELRQTELANPAEDTLILRMGVRSGGCSGMSYVMDIVKEDDAKIADDDMVDEYTNDKIQCVVDAKSMLYLYGLELDYSTELIGGGFKFFNPNAEESCGCGSSFGV